MSAGSGTLWIAFLIFFHFSYIKLVLRVLAYVCDGQYLPLQNYLREQPDNIKSVNLISEVTRFLSLTYTTISRQSISLVTQIFETLVEFTSVRTSMILRSEDDPEHRVLT